MKSKLMKNIRRVITVLIIIFSIGSCSKKTHPAEVSVNTTVNSNSGTVSSTVKPAPLKRLRKTIPKVIVVNDIAASKTFDGRYYYDLDGHRYWRNHKDGKYYLYNKSMNTDPAFKKP